jgi:hypothetical protein
VIAFTVQGTDDLARRLLDLGRDAPVAAHRAIRRTLRSGTVAVGRLLAEDTGLTQRAIRRSLTTTQGTYQDLRGTLAVGLYRDARGRSGPGGRIPLIEFRARGPEPSRGKGRGVRYTLPSGRGLAPRAFIATMPSGHRGVFARLRPTRSRRGMASPSPALPISQLYGPSLYRVMRRRGLAVTLPEIQTTFERHLAHEIGYVIEQRRIAAGGE